MEPEIIYTHDSFLVISKPAGMPVQKDPTKDTSLEEWVVSKSGEQAWIVHRIDRPVSGLVLMARSQEAADHFRKSIQAGEIERTYLAITSLKEIPQEGILTHYLRKESKKNKTYSFDKPLHHTKKSTLNYKVLSKSDRYQLLQVNLLSGRHHQIRSQFGATGIPVRGDVKYGFRRSNKDRSIHLHAWKLAFTFPGDAEKHEFETAPPVEPLWSLLMEGLDHLQ